MTPWAGAQAAQEEAAAFRVEAEVEVWAERAAEAVFRAAGVPAAEVAAASAAQAAEAVFQEVAGAALAAYPHPASVAVAEVPPRKVCERRWR